MGDKTLAERVMELEGEVVSLRRELSVLHQNYEAMWDLLRDHLQIQDRFDILKLAVNGKGSRKGR